MRIGELAHASGTTTKTLRFYEQQGLMPDVDRTAAGYRDYSRDAIARVDFIHRGKAAGLTLAQIRRILDIRDRGHTPCAHVLDLLDSRLAEIDRQISELRALRATITQLRAQANEIGPDTCDQAEVCRYL